VSGFHVKRWPDFSEEQQVNPAQRDSIQSTLHFL